MVASKKQPFVDLRRLLVLGIGQKDVQHETKQVRSHQALLGMAGVERLGRLLRALLAATMDDGRSRFVKSLHLGLDLTGRIGRISVQQGKSGSAKPQLI